MQSKLQRKNLDMIVIHFIDEGAGFPKDTNKVKICIQNKEFSLKSKDEVAKTF